MTRARRGPADGDAPRCEAAVRALTVACSVLLLVSTLQLAAIAGAEPAAASAVGFTAYVVNGAGTVTTVAVSVTTFGGTSAETPFDEYVYAVNASSVDSAVISFGAAADRGGPLGPPAAPLVGMASSPTGLGYWIVGADGSVFSYGDAVFHGSMGSVHLNSPVVGIASTPSGGGYWLAAADGGVFGFGDAHFYGSMGAQHLNLPMVGMAVTPSGDGYWFVAADGGVYAFGDAPFLGSGVSHPHAGIVTGIAARPDGRGYWISINR